MDGHVITQARLLLSAQYGAVQMDEQLLLLGLEKSATSHVDTHVLFTVFFCRLTVALLVQLVEHRPVIGSAYVPAVHVSTHFRLLLSPNLPTHDSTQNRVKSSAK